jgi:ATP-dependent HslUV protease ATP-binding subunit HslU
MLLETEGVQISFSEDALDEIAKYAMQVNEKMENIGARRLHTIMERLLEDILFEAPEISRKTIHYTGEIVRERLDKVVRETSRNSFAL